MVQFVVYTEPGQVSNLKTTPLSETSIYITWAQPQRQNGIILYYEVSVTGGTYMMTDNYTTLNATLDGFGRPNNKFNYNLLTFYIEPYVHYTVVVRAATSVGKGDPQIMTFYTKEGSKYIHCLKQ